MTLLMLFAVEWISSSLPFSTLTFGVTSHHTFGGGWGVVGGCNPICTGKKHTGSLQRSGHVSLHKTAQRVIRRRLSCCRTSRECLFEEHWWMLRTQGNEDEM